MHYIGLLLLICVAVKIKAIISATIWLAKEGESHAATIRRLSLAQPEISEDDFYNSFINHHGNFLPFGVKDYRLRIFHRELMADIKFIRPSFARVPWIILPLLHLLVTLPLLLIQAIYRIFRWILGIIVNIARLLLFQYVILSCSLGCYLIIAGLCHRFPHDIPVNVPAWSAYFIAFPLMMASIIMNLAMAVEFVLGHLFLSNYAVYFHMLSPKKIPLAGGSSVMLGLQILIMLALVVFLSGVASVLGCMLMFDGFGGGVIERQGEIAISDVPSLAGFCAYYTLTTLTTTGYGDIVPKNGYGVIIGTGLQIEAFAIVVFGLSVFWSGRSPEGESHNIRGSPNSAGA